MEHNTFNLPDTPGNPFRINPPEGQMMAVMKSSKDGPLDRIIASVTGWHFKCQEAGFMSRNKWDGWELVEDTRAYSPKKMSMPEAEFGIIMVGFLRALHIPHIRYAKWEMKPGGSTDSALVPKERSDSPFFFFQYDLGIPVVEVESVGNFKTTVRINVVVRLVNPYRALFLAGGWESLLSAAVHGAVRDHLSDLNIEDIRAEKETSGALTARIRELNLTSDGFKDKFGVEVIDLRFVGFDIVGSEKVQQALEANEVNRLMADASVQKAREIATIGKAQADALALSTAALGGGLPAAIVKSAEVIATAIAESIKKK